MFGSIKRMSVGFSVFAVVALLGFGLCWFNQPRETPPGQLVFETASEKGRNGRNSRAVASSGEAFCPSISTTKKFETVLSFSLINPDDTDVFCPPGLRVHYNLGVLDSGIVGRLQEQCANSNSLGLCRVIGTLTATPEGLVLVASDMQSKR